MLVENWEDMTEVGAVDLTQVGAYFDVGINEGFYNKAKQGVDGELLLITETNFLILNIP